MALIKCPECGKKVSENAKSCPNCGEPIKNKKNKFKTNNNINISKKYIYIIGGVISIIIIFLLLMFFTNSNSFESKLTKEKWLYIYNKTATVEFNKDGTGLINNAFKINWNIENDVLTISLAVNKYTPGDKYDIIDKNGIIRIIKQDKHFSLDNADEADNGGNLIYISSKDYENNAKKVREELIKSAKKLDFSELTYEKNSGIFTGIVDYSVEPGYKDYSRIYAVYSEDNKKRLIEVNFLDSVSLKKGEKIKFYGEYGGSPFHSSFYKRILHAKLIK